MSYVIVGLGNPGQEYEQTRHNVGRITLDFIQENHDFSSWQGDKYLKSYISSGQISNHEIILLKPETYMNRSGETLATLSKREKFDLIVIHDDIDLPLGKIRIVKNRGEGGHNGLISIVKFLKTTDFVRIRIGVCPVGFSGKMKKPIGKEKVDKFILGKFSKREMKRIEKIFPDVAQAISLIISEDIDRAMNRFN
jgi:PTH1 family peptidyl-tRNA hydrolase